MRLKFAVDIDVVFSSHHGEGRDVDGYMQNSEESEWEHGRDRLHDCGPIDSAKVLQGLAL